MRCKLQHVCMLSLLPINFSLWLLMHTILCLWMCVQAVQLFTQKPSEKFAVVLTSPTTVSYRKLSHRLGDSLPVYFIRAVFWPLLWQVKKAVWKTAGWWAILWFLGGCTKTFTWVQLTDIIHFIFPKAKQEPCTKKSLMWSINHICKNIFMVIEQLWTILNTILHLFLSWAMHVCDTVTQSIVVGFLVCVVFYW